MQSNQIVDLQRAYPQMRFAVSESLFFSFRFDSECSTLQSIQLDTNIYIHTCILFIYLLFFALGSISGSRRQRLGHTPAYFPLFGRRTCLCECYQLCIFGRPPLPRASHRPSAQLSGHGTADNDIRELEASLGGWVGRWVGKGIDRLVCLNFK